MDIHHLKLSNGSNGVSITNAENYNLYKCFGEGFDGWAFSSSGELKNIIWEKNISINNTYDGLKMSGVIENVLVTENTCYGNGRDGFDFAGHSIDGLIVAHNFFNQNGVEGIEVKLLNPMEYPFPTGVKRKYKNILVAENSLDENESFGINMTNRHIEEINETKSVIVQDNNISKHDDYNSTTYGMRLQFTLESKEDVIVEKNNINGKFDRGIRIINSKNLIIKRNTIHTESRAIELEVQAGGTCEDNLIEDNDLTSEISNGVTLLTETEDNVVKRNRISAPAGQYRVNISPTSRRNISQQNEWKNYNSSQMPTGRATKGDIAYSSDMVASGCLGWVAMDTSSEVTWKPFGEIAI